MRHWVLRSKRVKCQVIIYFVRTELATAKVRSVLYKNVTDVTSMFGSVVTVCVIVHVWAK